MKIRSLAMLLAAPTVLVLAGCVAPGYYETQPEPVVPTPTTASLVEHGIVRTIALVDVATSAPGGGAAVVGNRVVQRGDVAQAYRVDVLTDAGSVRSYRYSDLNGLQVGDRVRIQSGQLYRN